MNKKQTSVLIVVLVVMLSSAVYTHHFKKDKGSIVEVPSRMSEVEVAAYIANPPGPNASQQEGWDFYNRIQSVAVQSNSLDITGCKPSPQVISVKKGATLNLKNDDTVIHTLAFNPRYSIAGFAQNQTVVNLNLGDLIGVFPYSCDMQSNAGYILVIE